MSDFNTIRKNSIISELVFEFLILSHKHLQIKLKLSFLTGTENGDTAK